MDVNFNFISSFFLSLLLHAVLVVLLVFSFDNTIRKVPTPIAQVNIVKAVSVDSKQVETELQRLRDIENEKQEKQQQLEKKLKELENRSKKVEQNRKAEEKRLAELRRKKTAEQKKREDEQKKLEQLKQEQAQLEKRRKEEQERQRKLEEEKKKQAELKKKQEQERKQKEEQERQRKAEELRLQQELAEEQAQQEAAQRSRDQRLLQNIVVNIKRSIVSNFNKSGLPKGLECVLSVRLVPGGEVISVTISKSSGSDVFDRRALVAVQKASPLPIPEDAATFERLRLRQIAFTFRPED